MWYDNYFMFDMGRCKNQRKLAKMQNNKVFINTFFKLMDIALMRYNFENLPETVSDRLIKQALICFGSVVFFEKDGGILALAGVPSGDGYNINGDPVSCWVFSRNGIFNENIPLYIKGGDNEKILYKGNGYSVKTGKTRGVMIWENKNRYPFLNHVMYYSKAISDTLRTVDVARTWLKIPAMPVCEESLVESVKAVFGKLKDNDEIIPVSSGIQTVDKFDLKPVGDITKNIQTATELIDWYEMQYRALCGFKANTAIDKKGENLIADEVHINDSYTDSMTESLADYLTDQIDIVNEVFGLQIKVVENDLIQNEKGADSNDENI